MSLRLPCNCSPRFIRSYDGPPRCSKCNTLATEDSPPAKVFRQLDVDYACPVTGAPIRSKKAHEENLRLHGCHVLEKGEMEDAQRNRAAADAALEAKLEATAEQLVATLPEEKRKALETEAIASDLQVTRG